MPKQKTIDKQQKNKKNGVIEKKLENIYKDDNGAIPDLTHIEGSKTNFKGRLFGWTILIIIIAISAGWASNVFKKTGNFDESGIKMSITGPVEAPIGSEVTYEIKWSAPNGSGIKNNHFLVNYPKGFIFKSADAKPANEENNTWDMEYSEPAYAGALKITGILYGAPGQEQSIRAFLNYKPANFNSTFQQAGNFSTVTKQSPVDITVTGPDTLLAKSSGNFEVKITNISDKPFDGLSLNTELHDGASVTWQIDKAKGLSKNTKLIPTATGVSVGALDATTTISIPVLVNFGNSINPTSTIKFNLNKLIGNENFIIATYEKQTRVETNALDLQLIINGSDSKTAVSPNDTLSFTLFFENKSSKTIKNGVVTLTIDSPSSSDKSIIDWAKLVETQNSNITAKQINQNTRRAILTWNKSSVPALAKIEHADKGNITFQIPIKSDSKTLDSYNGFNITAKAGIKADTEAGVPNEAQTNEVKIILNSDLSLTAEQKKLAQDQYELKMIIKNTWHPLKDLKLKSMLFGGVEWKAPESVPAGLVNFDAKTQELSWTIKDMPLEADVLVLKIPLKIIINPTQTVLMDKITFSATDSVTGEVISLTHPGLPITITPQP